MKWGLPQCYDKNQWAKRKSRWSPRGARPAHISPEHQQLLDPWPQSEGDGGPVRKVLSPQKRVPLRNLRCWWLQPPWSSQPRILPGLENTGPATSCSPWLASLPREKSLILSFNQRPSNWKKLQEAKTRTAQRKVKHLYPLCISLSTF